jgi:hypothetical protein
MNDKASKIAKLLTDNGVSIDDIGKIDKVRISEREIANKMKDAYGGEHVVKDSITTTQLVITPSWDQGPEWPVVQQAKPTKVTPVKATKKQALDGWEIAVILPDTQIGFRQFPEGLDPFHDERAMQIALKIIRDLNPHKIINLGDFLDLPSFGTYEQEPAFANTTQETLDRAGLFLAEQRASAPDAQIELIEGNHDRRLQKMVLKNAMAAFGLRRAGDPPTSWPVMSVPYLLRLEDLDITYVEGYPAGITWINDNLACVHGSKVRSNGSTAAAVVDDERVSIIHGHIHRIEEQHKTRRTASGPKFSFAASPGCLCRIDGAVPSAKSSTDSTGRPVNAVENWQQGLGIVHYEPGNGRFAYQAVPIYDGWAMYNGKEYSLV